MKTNEIHLRDPFVLPRAEDRTYYLFGTTDPDPWRSPGVGFDAFTSKDLETWEGPFPAWRPKPGFWGTTNFWAPEVHPYRGAFYLFASFKGTGTDAAGRGREGRRRATQILKAESPLGPFRVHSPGPVTPPDWECLDGTLFVDDDEKPWIVFCHEWVQVRDGEIHARRLTRDLTKPEGEPVLLFTATQASWTRPHLKKDGSIDPRDRVTDGPFLYRDSDGALLMLWSSFSDRGYAMGVSRSESGGILGPWRHNPVPLADNDSGHGMIFRAFDGRLFMTVHAPNRTPEERPVFVEIEERDGTLVRKQRIS